MSKTEKEPDIIKYESRVELIKSASATYYELITKRDLLQSQLRQLERQLLEKSTIQRNHLNLKPKFIAEKVEVPEIYVPRVHIYQQRLIALDDQIKAKQSQLHALEAKRDQLKAQVEHQEAEYNRFIESMKAHQFSVPQSSLPQLRWHPMPLLKTLYDFTKFKEFIQTLQTIIPDKIAVLKLLTIPYFFFLLYTFPPPFQLSHKGRI